MAIDLIITTYNRPNSIIKLCNEAKCCNPKPNKIIVVDSSDNDNITLLEDIEIDYIKSSHKNQPYQRFLGLSISKSEIVCFFDDDLTILDFELFGEIESRFKSDINIVGVGSLIDFPGKVEPKRSARFIFLSMLTGVPVSKPGKVNIFGQTNSYSQKFIANCEVFNGGIMSFKKFAIIDIFTDDIFSLFEKKWGQGEDKFISFYAAQKGVLHKLNKYIVQHPSEDSHYFVNTKDFEAKILISRLWLALHIGKAKRYSKIRIVIAFYYYAFWRLLISGFMALMNRKNALQKFEGNLLGIKRIFNYGINSKKLTPDIKWAVELEKDIKTFNKQ